VGILSSIGIFWRKQALLFGREIYSDGMLEAKWSAYEYYLCGELCALQRQPIARPVKDENCLCTIPYKNIDRLNYVNDL